MVLTPGIDGPIIPPGGTIPTVISDSGLGAIMKTVQDSSKQIFPRFEKITGDISDITGALKTSIVDDNGAAGIKQIREDVTKITENVKVVTEEMRAFLKEQVYPRGSDIKSIMENLQRVSATLANAAGPSVERVDRILERLDRVAAAVDKFIGEQTAPVDGESQPTVKKSLALLEGSMENIRKVTEKLEEGRGTLGRLLTDSKLVNDIEHVVSDVETSPRRSRAPRSRSPSAPSMRRARRLQDDRRHRAAAVARRVLPVPAHRRPARQGAAARTRVTVSNDPRVPPVLVEEISTTTKDFKISGPDSPSAGG
ncbi:MAG: hypothetical protein U1F43_18680 [Myxococcota bacterium]